MQAVTSSHVAELRAGIAIELVTIAWMLIEASIALGGCARRAGAALVCRSRGA